MFCLQYGRAFSQILFFIEGKKEHGSYCSGPKYSKLLSIAEAAIFKRSHSKIFWRFSTWKKKIKSGLWKFLFLFFSSLIKKLGKLGFLFPSNGRNTFDRSCTTRTKERISIDRPSSHHHHLERSPHWNHFECIETGVVYSIIGTVRTRPGSHGLRRPFVSFF